MDGTHKKRTAKRNEMELFREKYSLAIERESVWMWNYGIAGALTVNTRKGEKPNRRTPALRPSSYSRSTGTIEANAYLCTHLAWSETSGALLAPRLLVLL